MKLLIYDFYKEMHGDMIGNTVTISESVLLFLLHKSDRMGCNLVEAETVSAVGERKVAFVVKVFENSAYINGFHRILVEGNLARRLYNTVVGELGYALLLHAEHMLSSYHQNI